MSPGERALVVASEWGWPLRLAYRVGCMVLALVAVLTWSFRGSGYLLLGAIALALLEPFLFRRRAARRAVIRAEPGRLQVGRESIRAADVGGARVALAERTVALLLHRRRTPTIVRFESDAALMAALRALGISMRGRGAMDWDLRVRFVERVDVVLRAALACALIANVVLNFSASASIGLIAADVALALAPLVVIAAVWARVASRTTLTLVSGFAILRSDAELHTFVAGQTLTLRKPDTLVIGGSRSMTIRTSSSRFTTTGISSETIPLLAAFALDELNSAGLADLDSIADFSRREESVAQWLGRIDSIRLDRDGQGVYRGGLSLAAAWAAFIDPDHHSDTRVAAARVLGRDGEMKLRVREMVSTIYDGTVRLRVNAALNPDLAAAARQIEAADEIASDGDAEPARVPRRTVR